MPKQLGYIGLLCLFTADDKDQNTLATDAILASLAFREFRSIELDLS